MCFPETGLITAIVYIHSYMQCLSFYAFTPSMNVHERPLRARHCARQDVIYRDQIDTDPAIKESIRSNTKMYIPTR